MTTHPLAKIPLFADLTHDELVELESMLVPRQYTNLKPIFWVEDPGEEFYMVREGKVQISCPDETGNEVTLGTLGAGHFFGEISLLDGGPRTATARSIGDTTLLCLSREPFIRFLMQHPDAAVHMLTIQGRRQRATVQHVRGIRNVNEAADLQRTRWQVVVERIASVTATHWFIALNLAFFASWVVVNLVLRSRNAAFDGQHFDLLGLIVTIEALFISLFVLISQNLQRQRDRIRSDLDYQVNLKAHQEVMQLQQKVDQLGVEFRNARNAATAHQGVSPDAQVVLGAEPEQIT